MDSESRAPRQARSRQTEARLLTATVAVLADQGLAGVTIPEIAAAAGVATGSIYRRFQDKEALLRAAFLSLLVTSQETNRAALRPDRFAGLSLEAAIAAVVHALVRQYRAHPRLMKALDQFLETQVGSDFHVRAIDLIAGNARMVVDVLTPFASRVTTPDPERAITFALLSAVTVIEMQTLQESALWRRMLDLDDPALEVEVARAMLAYLTAPAGLRPAPGD